MIPKANPTNNNASATAGISHGMNQANAAQPQMMAKLTPIDVIPAKSRIRW
ncbi:MAG: hypothetical protein Fur0032_09930 [Terrimicrobiaceae bacterium]